MRAGRPDAVNDAGHQCKWRRRFLRNGCDGLLDEPRSGTPRSIGDDEVEQVVVRTLEHFDQEPSGARSMARACGVSLEFGDGEPDLAGVCPQAPPAKPSSHRGTRCLSRKVRDIVRAGRGVVRRKFKPDRTQPLLPASGLSREANSRLPAIRHHLTVRRLERGHRGGMREVLPQHRSVEFKKFLDLIDQAVPPEFDSTWSLWARRMMRAQPSQVCSRKFPKSPRPIKVEKAIRFEVKINRFHSAFSDLVRNAG